MEWRAQRLDREKVGSDKTLYKTDEADRVNYVDNLSAFGIKQVTKDGG